MPRIDEYRAALADLARSRPGADGGWIRSEDHDVRWVMEQNLAKKRIAVAGAEWVAALTAELA